jgi:hypothetical protein
MDSAVGGGTNRQRFKIEETLDRRTTKFLFIVCKKRSQDRFNLKLLRKSIFTKVGGLDVETNRDRDRERP